MKGKYTWAAIFIVILLILIWVSGIWIDPYWREDWDTDENQIQGQWLYQLTVHYKDGHNESFKVELDKPITIYYESSPISALTYTVLATASNPASNPGLYSLVEIDGADEIGVVVGISNLEPDPPDPLPFYETVTYATQPTGTEFLIWGPPVVCNVDGSPESVYAITLYVDDIMGSDPVNYPGDCPSPGCHYSPMWVTDPAPTPYMHITPTYSAGGTAPTFDMELPDLTVAVSIYNLFEQIIVVFSAGAPTAT